jgi:protein-S-isoprenylcysteine O-methyltransferase Ste14
MKQAALALAVVTTSFPAYPPGMTLANRIIPISWLCFVAYWFISARFTKRTAARAPWWGGTLGRAAILILVFLIIRQPPVWHQLSDLIGRHEGVLGSPTTQAAGMVLCFLGMGFAVWARIHLGRNWGGPMSLREGHELVTSGPYAMVRHPIYTGLIVALFGTALAQNLLLLAPFGILWAYYLVSAVNEEKLMLGQFPDQYPQYKKRTKMLIPFVF